MTVPSRRCMSPRMADRRDDFPLPTKPVTPTRDPGVMFREMWLRSGVSSSHLPLVHPKEHLSRITSPVRRTKEKKGRN